MTTDWKALCAELVNSWTEGLNIVGPMHHARAALSQPEPEGLTEWELLDLGNDVMGNPLPCDPDLLLVFARALIAADRARWGRPAVEPETNGQT